MQPTTDDLQAAFNRSKLPRLGYSFQAAMDCVALKICLVRISLNMQKHIPIVLPKHPAAPHWTDKY